MLLLCCFFNSIFIESQQRKKFNVKCKYRHLLNSVSRNNSDRLSNLTFNN